MNHGLVTAAYIVAAIFFIFSLAGLSRQESAKNGNLYGIIGMAIALVATLYSDSAGLGYIILAMLIGAAFGIHKAHKVEMTQMPELIALLHSFVGLAAVLVGISSYAAPGDVAPEMHTIHLVEVFVGVFIGAVTFTGSLVAFGKLNGKISSKPLQLPGKHKLNLAVLVASLILLAVFLKSSNPHETVETLYRLVNGKPEAAMVISNGASSAAAIAALTLMTLIALPPPAAPESPDYVLLDRVQDAGNVGTVLRSAAAAGIRQIVLGEGCADAYSPKVLRAGMGAHFLLHIQERVCLTEWCARYPHAVYATALDSNRPALLYQLDLRAPCAWIFGNEGSGVSPELIALAGRSVKIPMQGATESLNIAQAATVCLFEQMRQRWQQQP